jgi:hypothetical protein
LTATSLLPASSFLPFLINLLTVSKISNKLFVIALAGSLITLSSAVIWIGPSLVPRITELFLPSLPTSP